MKSISPAPHLRGTHLVIYALIAVSLIAMALLILTAMRSLLGSERRLDSSEMRTSRLISSPANWSRANVAVNGHGILGDCLRHPRRFATFILVLIRLQVSLLSAVLKSYVRYMSVEGDHEPAKRKSQKSAVITPLFMRVAIDFCWLVALNHVMLLRIPTRVMSTFAVFFWISISRPLLFILNCFCRALTVVVFEGLFQKESKAYWL